MTLYEDSLRGTGRTVNFAISSQSRGVKVELIEVIIDAIKLAITNDRELITGYAATEREREREREREADHPGEQQSHSQRLPAAFGEPSGISNDTKSIASAAMKSHTAR